MKWQRVVRDCRRRMFYFTTIKTTITVYNRTYYRLYHSPFIINPYREKIKSSINSELRKTESYLFWLGLTFRRVTNCKGGTRFLGFLWVR